MLLMAGIHVRNTAEAEHGAFLDHDWLAALAWTTSHRLDTFFTTKFHAISYQALASVHALQADSLYICIFDLLRFGE